MQKVWMHKETGDLVIVTPVYAQGEVDAPFLVTTHIKSELLLLYFNYVGLMIENGEGMSFVMPDCKENRELFEVIGEL